MKNIRKTWSHTTILRKWKTILIVFSDNLWILFFNIFENCRVFIYFLNISCNVKFTTVMNFYCSLTLKSIGLFCTLKLFSMYDFVISCIGHLENTGLLCRSSKCWHFIVQYQKKKVSITTSLIRNTVASCLYYSNSHSAGFWFHFCHPSSLVLNTATALILVNPKPDFKCSNDSHFHSQFKPRSLRLIAYAILCKLGLDSFPLLSIFIVSALATLFPEFNQ